MGGSVSTGVDNDDLIDNLCDAHYIRTEEVERVFRAVDRGEYILPEHRMNAYKDQAWRGNHLHMSAPCIYSEVMEGLSLKPGISFLNLGSGTGYLSTMAGLILGSNGVNHGVEFYEDVVEYAYKKLEVFKMFSGAMDEFDFCEPKFMKGNCLCLNTDRLYDRVYVGAACPEFFANYMKKFVAIGGILVMPFNDQLVQIKRISQTRFDVFGLLPVSFATLILPKEDNKEFTDLIELEPQSLQSICRSTIRNILRLNVDIENPELKTRKHSVIPQNVKHKKRRMVLPEELEPNQNMRQFLGLVLEGNIDPDWTVETLSISSPTSSNSSSEDIDDEGDLSSPGDVVAENVINDINIDHSNSRNRIVFGSSNNDERNHTAIIHSDNNQGSNRTGVFDSGLGNELQSDDMSLENNADSDSSDMSVDPPAQEPESDTMPRRISFLSSSSEEDTTTNNTDTVPEVSMTCRRIVESPYTEHMHNKIKELPLPPILKDYLNYHRL